MKASQTLKRYASGLLLVGVLLLMAAPGGAVPGDYADNVLADSPAGYWRLGESGGTVAADAAGNNPGVYTGGVTLGAPGGLANDLNTSASFDGINDSVAVEDADSLDATTGVTVEAWVKRVRSNAYQVVVGKPGNGQSKHEHYALWIDSANLAVAYFGNGSTFVRVASPNPIDTNWHYLVATYDNATAKMYVDGVLTRSVASTVQLTPNGFALNIGRARQNGYFFQGQIDEVAVYRTALSAARVQGHYEASTGDVTAPVVSLAVPANGSVTDDATPLFSGLAGTAPGDSTSVTVKIYQGAGVGGTLVQTLSAPVSSGSWSVDASDALADGIYTARAEQADAAGNTGLSSANTFRVDLSAPTVTLAQPADGSTTGDTTPTFSGTGGTATGDATSVTVKLYAGPGVGGTLLQTLSAPVAAGSWSVDASNALGAGTYTARAEQSDSAGNSGLSSANTFTVDDQTAPAVSLAVPANGSVTDDATPLFSGLAGTAPGDTSTVAVKIYSGSTPTGTPLQVLTAGPQGDGSYSIEATALLADGIYTARAEQADAAGNTGLSSANTFRVDLSAPTVTLAQPADGSTTGDTTPTFSGTGGTATGDATSVTVKLYAGPGVGGTLLQTLSAPVAAGSWSVDASNALGAGTYTARAEQSDSAGNSGLSSANTFTVDDQTAPAVSLAVPANGSVTDDATPLFSGLAGTAPGDSTSVTVKIYQGAGVGGTLVQTLSAPVSSGSWSVDASDALADGIYTARAEQADAAGNTGFSSANTFRVDLSAPTVTLAQPADGSTTGDTTPTFSGTGGTATGDATSVTVKLYAGPGVGGTLLQTLSAPVAAGSWSVDASNALGAGTYTARAEQSDSAGNSGLSSANTFTVDVTAPTVTLAQPANGSTTSDTTPTFSGTGGAAPGDTTLVTVKVYEGAGVGGTLVQTLNASLGAGSWSIDASSMLPEGTYTARAQQSDAAGNTGFSSANTFAVSTTGGAYRAEVLSDSPTSYWRLGEPSGTTAADERGTNPAAYVGGVLLNQLSPLLNDSNRAISLDGVNDYAVAPDSNSLDMTSGVTLETWVKRTKSAAYQVIVAKPGNGQSKLENYSLWLNTSNQLVAYFGNGTTHVSVSGGTIDTNWHHVAATYDNATARIFVDGTLRASTASSVVLTPNALPLNIGRSNDGSYFYGGLVDEVAVYPVALSATRIRAHRDVALGSDGTPPVVTLTSPSNGGSTNDTTPTMSGVAGMAPGDSSTVTVKVYSGSAPSGTPVQTLTASRQGNGSYTVDAATLTAGTFTAQAEQLDTAGNRGLSSPSTFSVDTSSPVVTLTQPAHGGITGTLPTFRGLAGASAGDSATVTVNVYVGPTPSGTPVMVLTTTRQVNSSYSAVADGLLIEGTFTAQARQSDAAGNSGFSSANTFIVSNVDVDPPAVTLQTPADGSSTPDTTPTLSGDTGTAPGDIPSVTVRIYQGATVNGTLVETLSATVAGNSWSVDASPPLATGVYTAQAEQSDEAGNLGRSSANVFQIGTSYRDEVLADAPRAYWRLGESAGTAAADQTGANPGSYAGGVTLGLPGAISADPNTAISLNGTSGHLTAPDSNSLDLTTGATIEVWVKRAASAPYQAIVGKPGDGQSKNENYALWLNSDLPVAYFGNGSNYAAVYATTTLDTNWHHIVATYNNATARLYIDGVLNASSTSTVNMGANALPLNIGRARDDTFFFGGQLDEVAVYPTALSATRVQAHFSKANAIDTTPPAVTLTTPENGSTTLETKPALAGAAAITATDLTTVTVKIYSGPTPTGTPVQTITTTRFLSGSWSTRTTSPLALGTYTAQSEQVDTAGNVGRSAPQTFTIATRPPVGTGTEFVGAGDIAYCEELGDEATAAVLDLFPSATVFTLGDNAYERGTLAEFNNCYEPSWGRHKARTRPTLGDHDYADGGTPNAPGYMAYFQTQLSPFGASATDPNRGYYSYDLGPWHVIALNAVCGGAASGCNPATQLSWLQTDLASHPNACSLALLSAPRFSSGSVHGNNADMQPYWDALAAAGTEMILSGDDHDYERFAPQDGQGFYQPQGIRQFVVGSGGRSHYPFSTTIRANSEVRNDNSYGILRLVLRPSGYEWEFVPEAGQTFTDSGSAACH